MLIELHLLQNFAPSCLNRDDTNTPKDCEFGGVRRARISSQCIKRSIRKYFASANLLPETNLASRSKRFLDELAKRLEKLGHDRTEAINASKVALGGVGIAADSKNEERTQYLLFLGEQEVGKLAELVHTNWDALNSPADDSKAKKTSRQQKSDAKKSLPLELAKKIKSIFDGGKAADLALFGRMLADAASLNIDAACQVAHAISTNRVTMEMDYFTAVDDLKSSEDDAGAGMLGTVEFNSACFYRYANISFAQLCTNLQGNIALAHDTVAAFLKAAILAIPTGKQNSMAAHNPPSLIVAVVRKSGPLSLANAFETPIYARSSTNGRGLVGNSIQAIDSYWKRLQTMYGSEDVVAVAACKVDDDPSFDGWKDDSVANVSELISKVLTSLSSQEVAA